MELITNVLTVGLVSLLAAISPGPDFLVVVKNSLSYSRRAGFLTSTGVAIALLIHLSYTLIGIGMLLREGSTPYLMLKYAGAGYLFYIGCKGFILSFKKQQTLDFCYAGSAKILSPLQAFKQGFFTNLLNPKCALFFVSFFSQLIAVGTPLSLKICYACINWSISLGWFLFLTYLVTGEFIMSRISRFRSYIERIMGIVLVSISLKLII